MTYRDTIMTGIDEADAEVAAANAATAVANEAVAVLEAEVARLEEEVEQLTPPKPPKSLLFWAGFPDGVSVGPLYNCYEAGCWQEIRGPDPDTGFSWPPANFAVSSKFQVRAGDHPKQGNYTPSSISEYIVNDFPIVAGRCVAPKRVQRTLIKKNPVTGLGGQGSASTSEQCPLLLEPKTQGDTYISFWRKIDPTLPEKLVNGWHVIFEWKTAGDYRVIAQIVNYGASGTPPWWEIRADNDANGGLPKQEFWRVNNRDVPVPIGEWFKFEVFWHRSKGSEGRVWMAVNGQPLVDKRGPNIGVKNAPINRIMPIQLYSAAAYPLQQWSDEVQIWSDFPEAKKGDPWYDGIYAPH